ncbi:MAG: hypothetical protein A2096_14605 [Spirochaetes bacterium GWF1_41_5]|nr:MAG: hypothetical protein A2096_14605 [Spirochaetes bacterium GWF1_41_5]HBE02496.1 hypothetical protein [Spirochaetia bacterium]
MEAVDGETITEVLDSSILGNGTSWKHLSGIHFNHGVNSKIRTSLIYFATAADYAWNPKAYDPVRSYQAAIRFIYTMCPLLGIEAK